MTVQQASAFVSSVAPQRLATAFGKTAGNVGILIALASIVGICLMESGAARTIIDRVLATVGNRRAPEALAVSSFFLGIPVFFDTVFYLMVPLARSLRRTLGKDYVLFILAILAGGSLAHSLIPPTPGPLQVADTIGVDVVTMMLVGLVVGACSSLLSLPAARLINRWVEVPLRPIGDEDADADDELAGAGPGELGAGPPFWWSLLPILLPVLLIASRTAWDLLVQSWMPASGAGRAEAIEALTGGGDGGLMAMASGFDRFIAVAGDKNVALGVAAVIALSLLRFADAALDRREVVGRALASGGTIILITAAGGAFGAMLRQAGIAGAISEMTQGMPGLAMLVVAFLITTSIRTLQGSSTVAMITAAGVLQAFAAPGVLPFHPVYLAMAIGAGSKPIAWMTDSGFWVICKMSGMTESEGLRTVSPMSTAMGLSALLVTILGAWLFPLTSSL
jgi:GntP family gluconate:H+ symporter